MSAARSIEVSAALVQAPRNVASLVTVVAPAGDAASTNEAPAIVITPTRHRVPRRMPPITPPGVGHPVCRRSNNLRAATKTIKQKLAKFGANRGWSPHAPVSPFRSAPPPAHPAGEHKPTRRLGGLLERRHGCLRPSSASAQNDPLLRKNNPPITSDLCARDARAIKCSLVSSIALTCVLVGARHWRRSSRSTQKEAKLPREVLLGSRYGP
jgi:hypothetical protein